MLRKWGVEMDESARAHEAGPADQSLLHPRVRGVVPGVPMLLQPRGEGLRNVYQEQQQAGRGPADGLQPLAYGGRTLPVRDRPVDVSELVGEPLGRRVGG